MNSHPDSSSTVADSAQPAAWIFWLLATSVGLCVANLYYCQPLLHQMQESFGATAKETGWIPTLTQAGYALGMLFLIPLGDRFEKRSLIVISTVVSAVSLVAMALAPTLSLAIASSLFIGVATMTPQFVIPMAAQIAKPEKRGQILGLMVSGVFLGILLARTVSGVVGAAFGWRVMFAGAAAVLFILSGVLQLLLPKTGSSFHGSYFNLLHSVYQLVREHAILREAMWIGGCLFGAFSTFWVTLIYLLEGPQFQLGPRAVGLFGLLGAAGALAAPLVGRLSDRYSKRHTIASGMSLVVLAFVIYWIWGEVSLVALSIGVVVMDIGIQSAHVANQSRIFSVAPEARSRLNTAYMFAYFVGGAAGSALASLAWGTYGWGGVCAVALSLVGISAIAFLRGSGRAA